MAEISSIIKEEKEGGGLFNFSLFLLFLSIISFLVFFGLEKKAQGEINALTLKLKEETPEEIRRLEEEVAKIEEKINQFEPLFQNHTFPSKIFDFVEANTHPKVFIQKFNFDLESLTISLSGKTDDFYTLGQQMLVLETLSAKKMPKISNLTVGKIQITDDQKIEFELKFNFDKEIIKPTIEDIKKSENENI